MEVNLRAETSRHVPVREASQVAFARRQAFALAASIGLAEATCAAIGLIVTEAATNLVKHAVGGECVLRVLGRAGEARRGIELVCLDRGPGMDNAAACLRDGYSTAGSLGTGLGAMQRLASSFDLYSVPGQGTVLVLELWEGPQAARSELALGALSVPRRGETACGDGWSAAEEAYAFLMVDGLGHGEFAAAASQQAILSFGGAPELAPELQIDALDRAMRATRGAAAAVASIDRREGKVRYCGIGNTTGTLLHADGVERMVSQPGTLGSGKLRVRPFEYSWTPATTMVLHTDGISARWDHASYPGIGRRHPSTLAAVLYRDFARGYDDATVLVVREAA